MTTTCESMRDRLPELAAGRLSPAEAQALRRHVRDCPGCGEELAVLEALAAAGPAVVPAGLEARIREAVAERGMPVAGDAAAPVEASSGVRDMGSAAGSRGSPGSPSASGAARAPRRLGLPAWGWAVAAVLALLLGRGVWVGAGPEPEDGDLGLMALASGEYSPLPADDGVVAGAPLLDGLSEDDLNALLEEWDG